MTPQTITTDFGFPSTDGRSTIHGIIWQPVGQKPVAVVQIIHGMAEHIERYEPFARYLAERGFLVCGHDHIGHGRSSVKEDAPDCLRHISRCAVFYVWSFNG